MKREVRLVGLGAAALQRVAIGLELGDRSSWYCVLDEAGEVRLEQKLGTTPTKTGV